MTALARALATVDYGTCTSFGPLSMLPLLARTLREPWYLTADEAIQSGRFRVTEVSEAGHVPELRVVNDLDQPVLLVDGEELVGAKQNRVVNLTVLVPARATVTLPVSCVEAGRWHAVSDEFAPSERAMFREARASKVAQVSASLARERRPLADQGEVWDGVARRAAQYRVRSATSAMHDIYEQQHHAIDEYVAALPAVERQVGAAFAIAGRLAGVELFDTTRTLFRLLPKIVSSYALDAGLVRRGKWPAALSAETVAAWLDEIAQVPPQVHEAVGLGTALRWDAPDRTAAALAVNDALVHFVAFPLQKTGSAKHWHTQMRSASWRRGGSVR